MDEQWKPISVCGGRYQVSSMGRVKSMNYRSSTGKEKVLKQKIGKDGYADVTIYVNKKPKTFRVHRLVAMEFLANPGDKPEVNHKDGNKLNNHVDNLEWVTPSENQLHAFATGLQPPPSEKQIAVRRENVWAAINANVGRKASAETKAKMSAAHKGKKHSAEWVQHWREAMYKRKEMGL